ncbi:hypothetical protein V22_07990 [Calycomorphotria hydatis]|uniref:Uncharacterized protein n=1 Tax=Calycomorphotria hydatis TaxID=2528027 RepID=A0A517T5B7_9PLAN|nr:hypothetical protein V22_07990 [Calycomorphotria hydatis]
MLLDYQWIALLQIAVMPGGYGGLVAENSLVECYCNVEVPLGSCGSL